MVHIVRPYSANLPTPPSGPPLRAMTTSPDHDLPLDGYPIERPAAPSRLRDRLREQTQAAILDAAERTITEEATAQARIDAIAAAAGVSVGTLYNHFADRDALVAAVIQDRRRVLLGHLAQLLEDQQTPFASKLHTFFELFAQAGKRHGRFFAVVMGDHGGLRSWQCQRDETIAAWVALARRLLQHGVDEGVLQEGKLDAQTAFLMGLARTAIMGPIVPLPAIATADMTHFFLHGAQSGQQSAHAGDRSPL